MPGAQPWMLGVANVRGNLLPIVDLKQFLEGERTVLHEGQRVLIVRQPGGDVAVTIDELYGQRSFNDEQQIPDGRAVGERAGRRTLCPLRRPGLSPGRGRVGRSSAWNGWPAPRIQTSRGLSRRIATETRGRIMSTEWTTSPAKAATWASTPGWSCWALSVLVFGLNTGVATYQGSRLAGASSSAANLQVLSQQLANQGREAVGGNAASFAAFKATKEQVDSDVAALRSRFGSEPGVSGPIEQVANTWAPLAKSADQMITSEKAVLGLAGNADSFTQRVPQLQAQLDEVGRAMSASGSPPSQIYIAVRELVLAATMARRVTEIRAGGPGASLAGDALARDAGVFEQVLNGLRQGGAANVQKLTNPAAAGGAEPGQHPVGGDEEGPRRDPRHSQNLFRAQSSAAALAAGSDKLLGDSQKLFDAFTAFGSVRDTRLFPNFWLGIISGIAALISIAGLLFSLYRAQQRRYQTTMELNNRNQEAIMRLLDEMGSLAEGDLTVKATVTEDMTGAIADSINFAVEQLRSLVQTINDTSVQVASSAQETQATAMHLAEAAEHQAQRDQLGVRPHQRNRLSINQVSKNSAESAEVAQRSVRIATNGAGVVRQTIQGMDPIRDQIQETSKRIKRLGESSQEIGSIVELINDISEQTNILALNAAIQAASAGEAGRGFAVVADEVQRLAERSSNATKRIESLVQTIQADTNEAVSSMEQTTSEVVAGARLAEDAGTALGEIEKVSSNLTNLIQNISIAAQQQSGGGIEHHPDDGHDPVRSPPRPRRAPARPPSRSATWRSSPPTCAVRSPTSSCRPERTGRSGSQDEQIRSSRRAAHVRAAAARGGHAMTRAARRDRLHRAGLGQAGARRDPAPGAASRSRPSPRIRPTPAACASAPATCTRCRAPCAWSSCTRRRWLPRKWSSWRRRCRRAQVARPGRSLRHADARRGAAARLPGALAGRPPGHSDRAAAAAQRTARGARRNRAQRERAVRARPAAAVAGRAARPNAAPREQSREASAAPLLAQLHDALAAWPEDGAPTMPAARRGGRGLARAGQRGSRTTHAVGRVVGRGCVARRRAAAHPCIAPGICQRRAGGAQPVPG